MKKISITFLFVSISLATNIADNTCIITSEDLLLYNKLNYLQKTKKTIIKKVITNKNIKTKSISLKIKKIKLNKMSLINLINYAIEHNLTTKKIGKLVVAKLETNKKALINNLDITVIKNTFLSNYSINDLKLLLLAIKTNTK